MDPISWDYTTTTTSASFAIHREDMPIDLRLMFGTGLQREKKKGNFLTLIVVKLSPILIPLQSWPLQVYVLKKRRNKYTFTVHIELSACCVWTLGNYPNELSDTMPTEISLGVFRRWHILHLCSEREVGYMLFTEWHREVMEAILECCNFYSHVRWEILYTSKGSLT